MAGDEVFDPSRTGEHDAAQREVLQGGVEEAAQLDVRPPPDRLIAGEGERRELSLRRSEEADRDDFLPHPSPELFSVLVAHMEVVDAVCRKLEPLDLLQQPCKSGLLVACKGKWNEVPDGERADARERGGIEYWRLVRVRNRLVTSPGSGMEHPVPTKTFNLRKTR